MRLIEWGAAALTLLVGTLEGCKPQEDAAVTIGKSTYVCLVLNSQNFTLFQPRADQYTRLVLGGTYSENKDSCQSNVYHIETMGVSSSFSKQFCSTESSVDFFFPILTAIINVDNGKVTSVSWDDGCYFTDDSVSPSTQRCIKNAFNRTNLKPIPPSEVPAPAVGSDTALTESTCNKQGPSFCDLAVYVAWTGTDSDGNFFGSSGRRFQIFREYDLPVQYEAMQKFL